MQDTNCGGQCDTASVLMTPTDLATFDLWSACPPDVLARCFKAQLDYTDNSGAGCACSSWNQTFRACGAEVAICLHPMNEALLSSTYLRQFADLHTAHLAKGADWQTESGTWLNPPSKQYTWGVRELSQWTEILQSVPVSCRCLTLDGFLPKDQNFLSGFSQLLNLQQLHIRAGQQPTVDLEDLGRLQQLQVLSLAGQSRLTPAYVDGSLVKLPAGLKRLELNSCVIFDEAGHLGFCLQDLSHLNGLVHLDLSFSKASFGTETDLISLQTLSALLLEDTLVCDTHPQSFINSLNTATRLQELVLRKLWLEETRFVLDLGSLLRSLPSLQRLDVTSCSHVNISPADCKDLRLCSFSFHYSQLMNIEVNQFNNFMQPFQSQDSRVAKPLLQVEGQFPHFGYQHWVQTLPLKALTHLTIFDAHKWPMALFFDSNSATLPNLQFLDVAFASLVSSDMDAITFAFPSNLRELYIAGTSCTSIDLVDCNVLTSLGVTHRGHEVPSISLPISLKKLYLHNILRAGTNADLASLSDLQYLKLGGRAATKGALRHLPALPQSLVELDLWDGLVRELNSMSLLGNLKKLVMPLPPSSEQMQIIRGLRQLRHVEVTTTEGMHSPRGKVLAPWSRSAF